MMPDPSFFTRHRALPREGPGQALGVHWALHAAAVPEKARIADLACGPAADRRTLAKARPGARIEAVDRPASFVAQARARVAAAGRRVLGERMGLDPAFRACYEPMARRIAALRPGAEAALRAVLDAAQVEIGRWRAASDDIAHALLIGAPE